MTPVSAKNLAQAKVKRQKQILAVGSVILLALLGFELPKLLGGGSDSAAPAVTSANQPGSPLAAAPGTLPDTDRPASRRDTGQLLSFGLFKSKDPFVQQLSGSSSGVSPSPPATTSASPPPVPPGLTPATTTTTTSTTSTAPNPPPPPPVTTSGGGETTSATTTSTTPAPPATPPTSVSISTNGVCESVDLNGTFPGNEDIFRVVQIAKDGKSIKIGVVGGSYDSGQATATLKLGETLTLVNTADGTRYAIALQTKCPVETMPAGPTATPPAVTTTTPTTTTPTTTPTTTATTPIVTDSLDTTTNPFG